MPETEAIAAALQWARLGYIRHAATLVAWLAALRAFYLMAATQDGEGVTSRSGI